MVRKSKEGIKLEILNYMLKREDDSNNVSTNVIADIIKSNFPTTKKYLLQIADLKLLNKVKVDGHIVGYSLNHNLLGLLMASKFSEICSLDFAKGFDKKEKANG